MRGIARRFPNLVFPSLAGISAGAVNTVHLAAHEGTLEQSSEDLIKPDIVAPGNKLISYKAANNGIAAANPALKATTSKRP